MRRNLGLGVVLLGTFLHLVFVVVVYVGFAVGIWWPLLKAIADKPLNAVWLLPFGLILTAISYWIQSLVYGILIALPLGFISTVLLRGTEPAEELIEPADNTSREWLVWWLRQMGLTDREAEYETQQRQRESERIFREDPSDDGWQRAHSLLYATSPLYAGLPVYDA